MDKNKLIETIKGQLKALVSSEVKFAEVKAGDLLITSVDEELVVGSEVFTQDQDGNNIPLGDGEYTLDSGEKITVTAGKIDAMAKVDAVEAEVEIEVEPTEEETPVEEEAPIKEDGEEDMGSKKMKELEDRMAKCESMLEEMSKSNNKMAQELSKVSGEPSTAPISVEPTEFKSVEDKKSGYSNIDIMSIREKARKNR
tara:strand:- start:1483 stop:2076 length:594 start_codon:yes stop_codon:yes gene_type:complete